MKRAFSVFCVLFGLAATAADVPGGAMRSATHLPNRSYEMILAPTYVLSGEGGAYLNSELRYQPYEEFGTGFSFGAGELGFNFGVSGVWHVLGHLQLIPRVAIVGGLYFNRVAQSNYFVAKVAPTVSHTFEMEWGQVTPYGAVALAPSFALVRDVGNLFSIKGSTGVQLAVKSWDGLRVHTELNWGLLNSTYEMAVGVSYPFAAL